MNFLHAIILGLVEGLTEFLPVSSTAHMIIAERLLSIEQTDFVKTFTISIQLGAVAAVVLLYWKTIVNNFSLWKKIIAAFLPTALIGLVFYHILKEFLLESLIVIAWSLLVGGIILIIFETFNKSGQKLRGELNLDKITYRQSVIIGLFQSLSIIPGVSRSAATIIGGLSLKINRATIVAFSFLLSVPTILVATVYDVYKQANQFTSENLPVWAVGFIVSFIVATLSIKFFINFVSKHTFLAFGLYRVVLGLALLAYLF